jgi:hypothetical protein
MKRQTKLNAGEEQQQAATSRSEQQSELEFQNPEALLRHDAAAVAVPSRVEQRLKESIGDSPAPRAAWWRRFLGGSNPP